MVDPQESCRSIRVWLCLPLWLRRLVLRLVLAVVPFDGTRACKRPLALGLLGCTVAGLFVGLHWLG